jgi:hypothetical protein
LPIEVLLRDVRARVLKERLGREKDRLRALLGTTTHDAQQSELSSKIVRLKQLETIALPAAQSEEQLSTVKAQIDEILMEQRAATATRQP